MADRSGIPRRALLAAGAVATWWMPGWLRRGLAQEAPGAAEPGTGEGSAEAARETRRAARETLAAFRRARRLAKPLLVLLVPQAWDERYRRGHAWGELINHGGDEALALLAQVEVVCTERAGVTALLPSFVGPLPLALLVETDRVPARGAAVQVELPDGTPLGVDEDTLVDRRIALLTAALRAAIEPSRARLAARAALARRRLPAGVRARVDEALRDDLALPDALADRAAAALAEARAGAGDPAGRRALEQALARAAAARLLELPPAGLATRWGHAGGCGATWERTPADRAAELARRRALAARGVDRLETLVVVGCGMGHVPERSQRFLCFFAAEREP